MMKCPWFLAYLLWKALKSWTVFAENNPDDHQNEEIYQTLIFLSVIDGIPIGCQLNEGQLESRKSRINDAGNLGRLLKLKIQYCVTLNVDMEDKLVNELVEIVLNNNVKIIKIASKK